MMQTAASLDLGPTPAQPAVTGAPSRAAGGETSNFEHAINDLQAEKRYAAERQADAASGKDVPGAPRTPPRENELPVVAKAADDQSAKDKPADIADTADLPDLEPALAWLLPVAVPAAPYKPLLTATVFRPESGNQPLPLSAPSEAASAPVPPGLPGGEPSAGPSSAAPPAAPDTKDSVAPTVPTASNTSGASPPFLQPSAPIRQPLPAAVVVEAQPPVRDSRLEPPAALRPVRLAPAAVLSEALIAAVAEPARPATTGGEATIFGLSAPTTQTVAPATSAQQAGIDLTRDPGLHRMIDRIEQLRDGADVRETRIRLIPDALGPVDIAVRRDGTADNGAVRVHFNAAEAATRQLIADAQPRLAELAETRGLRIERASIGGGDGGSQTWTGDGQPRPQPQAAQPLPNAPARAVREAASEPTDDRIA